MKRIPQLDFFRGLFLVVMTTHHFMYSTNFLFRLTNEWIGWLTAAEGFFFLSGFTTTIVYGRLYRTMGRKALLKATKKRMRTIYLHYLVVALLIAACVYHFQYMHHYWGPEMPKLFASKTTVFLLTPVLLYLPALFDILPLYLLFFTALPLAIRFFFTGKAWYVLIASGLLYVIGFFYVAQMDAFLDFKANHMPLLLNPFCWQLLFLMGVYTGYLFYTGKLQMLLQKKYPFVLAVIVSIVFFFLKRTGSAFTPNMNNLVDKNNLGPLRLLNFASLTVCAIYFCNWFRSWFTFRPLCYLGRYSLEVFSFHVLLVYFVRPVLPYLNSLWAIPVSATSRIYPVGTTLIIVALLALFVAPYVFLKRRINITGLRTASPPVSSVKIEQLP